MQISTVYTPPFPPMNGIFVFVIYGEHLPWQLQLTKSLQIIVHGQVDYSQSHPSAHLFCQLSFFRFIYSFIHSFIYLFSLFFIVSGNLPFQLGAGQIPATSGSLPQQYGGFSNPCIHNAICIHWKYAFLHFSEENVWLEAATQWTVKISPFSTPNLTAFQSCCEIHLNNKI